MAKMKDYLNKLQQEETKVIIDKGKEMYEHGFIVAVEDDYIALFNTHRYIVIIPLRNILSVAHLRQAQKVEQPGYPGMVQK